MCERMSKLQEHGQKESEGGREVEGMMGEYDGRKIRKILEIVENKKVRMWRQKE